MLPLSHFDQLPIYLERKIEPEILFDPCFQDEGLIFATDFHPILARGRPVDPQSTPNMGQMRSGWGEMATPIRLASTIQPIHKTVTNRSANSNSDEDVSKMLLRGQQGR